MNASLEAFMQLDGEARRLTLDPRDPRFFSDPFPAYTHLIEHVPVVFWENLGCWCFFADRDVQAILRDRRFGREVLHVTTRDALGWPDPPAHTRDFDAIDAHSVLEREPPFHTRVRRLINTAFVSRRVEGLKPALEAMAHACIDRFPEGPFDLIPAYAEPIPAHLIARLIGVPDAMVPQLLEWSHAMVAMYAAGRDRAVEEQANAAARVFAAYVREVIAERRRHPADDLLSLLISAEDDGQLSEAELVSTTVLLLNAGHEATVHALGNTVRLVLDSGMDPQDLVRDDAATARLVEEALRVAPPLHLFKRYVLEDLTYGGIAFRQGDQVALVYGATGRDPAVNASPDVFDPTRARPVHTSFGSGIHFCVGAPLARLELAVTTRVLFERCPRLRLTEPARIRNSWHFHGVERLMVAVS